MDAMWQNGRTAVRCCRSNPTLGLLLHYTYTSAVVTILTTTTGAVVAVAAGGCC
jgi:hypothetical protein